MTVKTETVNDDGLETAFLLVSVPEMVERELVEEMRKLPEVAEAYVTLGGWNVFLKIKVKDRRDIAGFVLAHLKGKAIETRTLFSLARKDTPR